VTSAPGLQEVAQACDERSDEIDELRHLPIDLARRLIGTGVMKTWVPEAYGGMGGTVLDLVNAVEEVSYFNGSAGWCAMIGGTTGLTAGFLPPEHGSALFGARDACGGGLAAPIGTARVVDDGLRVTGTWAWGSGTSHCTTIAGGVSIVDEGGQPATLPDGNGTCFAFFDPGQVELLDTWQTSGLRGTGSTHYRVDDILVPSGRWVTLHSPATPVDNNPLYRFSPFGALAMGVTAVLLGLGRRAIDELIALGDKRAAGSSRPLAERAVVQAELAQAQASIRSARAFVDAAVDECWAAAREGKMTEDSRALLRLAAVDASQRCKESVDLCYHAAGGTSVYKTSPLERVFRDTHVATQHAMVATRMLEPIGRMGFGLPTDTSQF